LKEWDHSKKKQIKQGLIEEWRIAGLLAPGQQLGELIMDLDIYKEELGRTIESKQAEYDMLMKQYTELSELIENVNHSLRYRDRKNKPTT
jgi:hypothetical protein